MKAIRHRTARATAAACLLAATSVMAGEIVLQGAAEWGQWDFPAGVLDIDDSVQMKWFSGQVDAAATASQFVHKDAKNKDVFGGVNRAGTNRTDGANILDGRTDTWWQPNPDAPLEDWWIEVDLGRLVQAQSIRLVLPDTVGAKPLREFTVYVSEGARQTIGKDVFLFDRIGGTTEPNEATEAIYPLRTIEDGKGHGDYLYTVENDTLEYLAIQYIRIIVHSKSELAALARIEVPTIGENLALGTVERGGSIRTGHDIQNVTGLFDGSATKWWTPDGRGKVDWRESGMWLEWDLGATFWVDQLNFLEYPLGFATTGHSNSYSLLFEWLTSDGSPVPTEGDDTIQGPYDYQLLSYVDNIGGGGGMGGSTSGAVTAPIPASQRTLKFDFRFPSRKTRYLFYHHEAPRYGFIFRVFEIFVYGSGFPAEVEMLSPFIDLEGTKSLRTIEWDVDLPAGAAMELRSRTGDTFEDLVFYYSKNGEEIPEARWNKLPKSQKLPLVTVQKAGADWSTWSRSYRISGESFLSPSPRRYAQLELRLRNESPDVTPVVHSITLNFDDPVISGGVFGEILPREALLDSLTEFSLRLGGQPGVRDWGFDRLGIELPSPLASDVRVLVDEAEVAAEVEESSDSLVVLRLPERVRTDSVEVILPLRVTDNAVLFDAWVSSSRTPERQQRIRPVEHGALTVFVPEIATGSRLLRELSVSTTVLSPNGDGFNDDVGIAVLAVKTSVSPTVTIRDLSGRQVAEATPTGAGTFRWDGRSNGEMLPPGIYLLTATLETDARTEREQRLIHLAY